MGGIAWPTAASGAEGLPVAPWMKSRGLYDIFAREVSKVASSASRFPSYRANITRRRKIMIRIIALGTMALTIGLASPGIVVAQRAVAQTAKDLVGTWKNVSNVNIRTDGTRVDVFGPNGTGLAIFDVNGRFAIINLNPDTPKFKANNRAQGTPEENKAAMEGGIGLFGTYTVGPDIVIEFKIEGSTYPNWTGTNQKRNLASFTPDEFKWTLPASIGGTAELVWRRMK